MADSLVARGIWCVLADNLKRNLVVGSRDFFTVEYWSTVH